jgi:hypothetical protein
MLTLSYHSCVGRLIHASKKLRKQKASLVNHSILAYCNLQSWGVFSRDINRLYITTHLQESTPSTSNRLDIRGLALAAQSLYDIESAMTEVNMKGIDVVDAESEVV